MSQVTLPHALTDGTTAYGSHVKANDDAIIAVLNANVDDSNIPVGANIKGSKLSPNPGERVPTDRIEDDAVTADKLRDDASTDANRAVTTNHIRDGAVARGKLKLRSFDWNPTGTLAPSAGVIANTSLTATGAIPLHVGVRFAGAPSTAENLVACVHFNTVSGTYYILLTNNGVSLATLSSYTIRLYYVEA